MALTTATAVDQISNDQPGTIGRLRAKRVVVTFTAGYDSTTGVTLKHADVGLAQIISVSDEGAASTGAHVQGVVSPTTGDATLTLWNGTAKVATSDQSATTVPLLVLGH